jgi:hypothetical protein
MRRAGEGGASRESKNAVGARAVPMGVARRCLRIQQIERMSWRSAISRDRTLALAWRAFDAMQRPTSILQRWSDFAAAC